MMNVHWSMLAVTEETSHAKYWVNSLILCKSTIHILSTIKSLHSFSFSKDHGRSGVFSIEFSQRAVQRVCGHKILFSFLLLSVFNVTHVLSSPASEPSLHVWIHIPSLPPATLRASGNYSNLKCNFIWSFESKHIRNYPYQRSHLCPLSLLRVHAPDTGVLQNQPISKKTWESQEQTT